MCGKKAYTHLVNHFQAHRHSFYLCVTGLLLTRPPLIDWVKLPFWLPETEWHWQSRLFMCLFGSKEWKKKPKMKPQKRVGILTNHGKGELGINSFLHHSHKTPRYRQFSLSSASAECNSKLEPSFPNFKKWLGKNLIQNIHLIQRKGTNSNKIATKNK